MIFLISDVHGDVAKVESLLLQRPYDCNTVVYLGDIGFGFKEFDKSRFYKILQSLPNVMFYLIQGNHDNADEMVNGVYDNVYHVTTYNGPKLVTIDHENVLMIPGAYSYDKHLRIFGVSWWENEQMTAEQYNELKAIAVESNIHTILSHDAPLQQYFNIFPTTVASMSNNALDRVLYCLISSDNHKNRQFIWVHGHLHYSYIEQIANVSIVGVNQDSYMLLV